MESPQLPPWAEGFVELKPRDFYSRGWPALKAYARAVLADDEDLEAIKTNWKKVPTQGGPLYIEWGWRERGDRQRRVLAISTAEGDWERHWVERLILEGVHAVRGYLG